MNKIPQNRKEDPTRKWQCFALLLLLFSFFVIIGMATIIVYYEIIQHRNQDVQNWPVSVNIDSGGNILYQDLTSDEMEYIKHYIMGEPSFNMNANTEYRMDMSYLFLAELYLPNKSEAINYLQSKLKTPSRNARIVLLRGDLQPPLVEEYVIGPLTNISFHRLLVSKHYQKSVPFLFRPFSKLDNSSINKLIIDLEETIGHILRNSYEASFFNCNNHCLKLGYFSPMSPSVSGKDFRLVWYWTHHDVDKYLLYPVDLFLLINMTGSDSTLYKVEKVWYGSKLFNTPRQLAEEYQKGMTQKSYMPYINKFRDAPQFTGHHLKPPRLIYPDGKRFLVHNNHVSYRGWNFDVRMSTTTGPSIFNVKFNDVSYAYEISLQEISVFHSGYKRWIRYSDINYSGFLLGTKVRELVSGTDCPEVSTFIHNTHVFEGSFNRKTFRNSFCVFEQSTGMILRRHYSSVYSGLEDITLVVRTILSIHNYDHVFDFIFHQNGVLDVQTSYSGFPLPTVYSPEEDRHGFRIRDELSANIHHYSCHFKVDLDVFGRKNRFETLDIETKTHDGDWIIQASTKYEQLKFGRSLKMTETQASFRHSDKTKSRYIFYNKDHVTKYKDPKALRLEIKTDGNPYANDGTGNEASVSWKRYILAVSKRHEDEPSSSSIYSMWDAKETVVNFQSFLDNNDGIIDQDLVAWITLDATHIPHNEDFPTMSTTNNQQYFTLSPFNLFSEDPSANSPDTVTNDG